MRVAAVFVAVCLTWACAPRPATPAVPESAWSTEVRGEPAVASVSNADEEKLMHGACKPLVDELSRTQAADAASTPVVPLQGPPINAPDEEVRQAAARSIEPARREDCVALYARWSDATLAQSKAAMASQMLYSTSLRLADAYDRQGKLCPSARPIPAAVPRGWEQVTVSQAEYEAGGWPCVQPYGGGLQLPIQLELVTLDQTNFELVVRFAGASRQHEWRLRGRVGPRGLQYLPIGAK